MNKKYYLCIILVLVFFGLCSCVTKEKKYIPTFLETNMVRLENGPGLEPIIVGVKFCDIYKAIWEKGKIKDWKFIFNPDDSIFTACTRQSIQLKDEYIEVMIGKTAFGAGGCCVGGGHLEVRMVRTGKS